MNCKNCKYRFKKLMGNDLCCYSAKELFKAKRHSFVHNQLTVTIDYKKALADEICFEIEGRYIRTILEKKDKYDL